MDTVRVTETFHSMFYATLYVAQARGEFTRQGLQVELELLPPGTSTLGILRSGQVDIALTGPMRGLVAADKGEAEWPLNFVELNCRDGFMLLSRTPAPNFRWADLVGQRVFTYAEPPTPGMCLRHALRGQGVDPSDVHLLTDRLVHQAVEAFQAGEGDYIEVQEPQAQALIAVGVAHFAAAVGPAVGHIPYSTLGAMPDYLAAHRDVAVRFTRAIYAAQQWLTTATAAEVTAMVAPTLPDVPTEVLLPGVARYLAAGAWAATPVVQREGFDRFQAILREGGLIRSSFPYEEHVDDSIARQALAGA